MKCGTQISIILTMAFLAITSTVMGEEGSTPDAVIVAFAGQTAKAEADEDGRWQGDRPGPFQIERKTQG